jgi:hypothetical protein
MTNEYAGPGQGRRVRLPSDSAGRRPLQRHPPPCAWLGPGLSFANPTRCSPSCMATGCAPTLPGVTADRQARVEDVHELALGLPHVTVVHGAPGNAVYQVGGRSFVFFGTPRPDAVDAATGERLSDVIVFWVESEADKQALVQDETTPFFTTPHFDGHNSVLVQASRLGEITRQELAELVQEPGSPRPPLAGEPPGWRRTARRRSRTRTRPTAKCGPSPDRALTGVALVGTGLTSPQLADRGWPLSRLQGQAGDLSSPAPDMDRLARHRRPIASARRSSPQRVPFRTQHPLGAVVNRPSVWSDRSIFRAVLVCTPNTDSQEATPCGN